MTEMKVQVSGEVPSEVLSEVRGQVGFITLNRPRALNALSLGMVRDLMGILLAWKDDARVLAVAIRGSNKEGPFGAFCAGGDIRFLWERQPSIFSDAPEMIGHQSEDQERDK